ncbi:MAG: hypothetical protein EA351_14245 [Gemmatimonadales bacterium]|nr:MAG: hypothetical protein EA351_14245 [Gemmatimonadales bacterium]
MGRTGDPDRSESLVTGLHQRLRQILREVDGLVRDTARSGELSSLSGPASLEAEKALAEMKLGLEAAVAGAAALERAANGEDALPPLLAHLDRPLPAGLPETVERFLRERSRRPGFTYRLENDATRGWTLIWKQRDTDGELLGAGHLFERPFSPPGR